MKDFITRTTNSFVSSAKNFFLGIANHWKGFSLLCLSTLGGASILTYMGISSTWALAGASAGVWKLAA